MNSTFRRLGPSELLPRYIFAESLFVRRRVLEVGAVASTQGRSGQFLAQRGARTVIACDADLSAVEEAQRTLGGPSLRFRVSVFDDLESGSFDLLLVADLCDYVRAPELLKELRRLVAQNGYLLGGLRNPAGLALAQLTDPEGPEPPPTYGQLLDALAPHFRSIEVATQSPVLGYQLAFERGEGLQVDGSLASAGEAAYFVVVAGQEPSRPFEPTWVQLPPEPLAFTGTKVDEYSQRNRNLEERSARLKQALDKARDELAAREAELSRTRSQLELARESEARLSAQHESLRSGVRGDASGDPLAARIRRLESELQVAKERTDDAERRLAQQRAEAEQAQRSRAETEQQVSAGQEAMRLERARRQEVADLLEDAKVRLAQAQNELRAAGDQVSGLRVEIERQRIATAQLDDELQVRGRELAAARERELKLAEGSSRLLAEVENLKAALAAARSSSEATAAQRVTEKAEIEQALRSAAQQSEAAEQARHQLEHEREHRKEGASARDLERASLEAELASTQAEAARLSRELESLTASERRLRELTGKLEEKLAAARDESRVQQLQEELEAAQARSHRLEHDISSEVSAERSAREQAEVALSEAQSRLLGTAEEHSQSLSRTRQLEALVDELRTDARTRESKLSAEIRELEDRLSATSRDNSDAEETRATLQAKLDSAVAESDRLRAALEARSGEERAEQEKAQATLSSARAEASRLRDELTAHVRNAEERARRAQAEAGTAKLDGQTLRERLESAGAEKRVLEDDRARLTSEVERLEAERARRTEELEAAQGSASQGKAELSAALADKDARIEILLRRLTAQESELAALRKSAARSPTSQVQQIYERAAAELTAVKAELFRRPVESAQTRRRPSEPAVPTPPALAAPPPGLAAKTREEKSDMGASGSLPPTPMPESEKQKP